MCHNWSHVQWETFASYISVQSFLRERIFRSPFWPGGLKGGHFCLPLVTCSREDNWQMCLIIQCHSYSTMHHNAEHLITTFFILTLDLEINRRPPFLMMIMFTRFGDTWHFAWFIFSLYDIIFGGGYWPLTLKKSIGAFIMHTKFGEI